MIPHLIGKDWCGFKIVDKRQVHDGWYVIERESFNLRIKGGMNLESVLEPCRLIYRAVAFLATGSET
jgi:hypothetical protein